MYLTEQCYGTLKKVKTVDVRVVTATGIPQRLVRYGMSCELKIEAD